MVEIFFEVNIIILQKEGNKRLKGKKMRLNGSCIAVFRDKSKLEKALLELKKFHLDTKHIFVLGEGFYDFNFPHNIIAEGLEEEIPPNGFTEIGNFLNYYVGVPHRFIVKYEQMLREKLYLLIVAKLPNIEKIKEVIKKSYPLDIAVHIT